MLLGDIVGDNSHHRLDDEGGRRETTSPTVIVPMVRNTINNNDDRRMMMKLYNVLDHVLEVCREATNDVETYYNHQPSNTNNINYGEGNQQ